MPRTFRVIDTGVREGRANVAFDQGMIDLHRSGGIPDTIRFLRFPPTVLIGRHQVLSHEVALPYCRAHGIGLARRITGGGAIYFDEAQLGWSLVFARTTLGMTSLDGLARMICEAAANGLRRLGIDARYRPRNDIEVEGRKISGTGGFFDGTSLFYQGTVLIDLDPATMVAALNVPAAKLHKHGHGSAAGRVTTLRQLLGEHSPGVAAVQSALLAGFAESLGIDPDPGAISAAEEHAATAIYNEEIGTDAFVFADDDAAARADVYIGSHTGSGGTVTCYLRLEGERQNRFREVLLTGDYFVTPPRVIRDLEAALRGASLEEWTPRLLDFFRDANVSMLSASPQDFVAAIECALATRSRHARTPS
jgi:lipoate-protein ligase A